MQYVIKTVLALSVLLYTSILDYRYREVEPKILYGSIITACVLTLAEIIAFKIFTLYHILSLILSVIVVIVIGLFSYFTGLLGGADVLILIFLALLFPWKFKMGILPVIEYTTLPIITFIINSLIIVVFYSIYFLLLNIVMYKDEVKKLNTPFIKKTILLLTGCPMKVSDYLKSKFMYPLEIIKVKENGEIEKEYRLTFNIEEEYMDHINHVKKLVEKGVLSKDTYIWVTPGIPLIIFILLGFILSITVGDIILNSFLSTTSTVI